MNRWSLLFVIALGLLASPAAGGEEGGEFAAVDEVVERFMERVDASAAAVAVSRGGVLVHSRGLGVTEPGGDEPTPPDALFRIASISKPITAAAVKKLIADDRLQPDTQVFRFLPIEPARAAGGLGDERLEDITVRQLLDHRGGWDREASYDPVFEADRVRKALRLRRPPSNEDLISYMLTEPLDFAPDERRAYSNFGYVVLGRVIERAGRMPYERYVREHILEPAGCERIVMGRSGARGRLPGEVAYPDGYHLDLELMDAAAGWVASAPELCRYMDHYWLSGTPRKPWHVAHWHFFGTLPGVTAYADQRLDGYNVAVLFNNRREDSYDQDNAQLRTDLTAALDAISAAALEDARR